MDIIKFLCDSQCISRKALFSFASTAPHRYKIYDIPKRAGNGTRTIAHPSKELKFMQRLLLSELEKVFTPHDKAFAYIKKRSIKDNAQVHVYNRYLLKMDFRDFFPSITPEFLFQECERLGIKFNDEEKNILAKILFFKLRKNSRLKLSIGAPTSPFISNLVMYHFDCVINSYCEKHKISYTRYADDVVFSTDVKDSLFSIPELVSNILNTEGYSNLAINDDKTLFTSKAHNRHVTGVTLTNDGQLSIGRDRKRVLSASVHRFLCGELKGIDVEILKGNLSFAFYIEPKFRNRLNNKYGEASLDYLFKDKNYK